MAVDPDCIFCGIVAGEIPSITIAQTERAVAFMDVNPATHGHALVIPRAHATDLLDVAAEDLAACAHLAQEVAGRAKDRLGADGVNLLNCSGADAWQSVFHFHFHVIPRFKGQPDKDSIRLPWDPVPGNLDEIRRTGEGLVAARGPALTASPQGGHVLDDLPEIPHADRGLPGTLELGAFSVSLDVADLDVSRRFYESLGFVVVGGEAEHGYLILRNGEATLGLFHGMFEGNILTFNPGLTGRMERVRQFTDVREIEQTLRAAGLEIAAGVDLEAGDTGPAHIRLTDPDGNAILIDQFF